jgi:diaminopimelate decarboxylase
MKTELKKVYSSPGFNRFVDGMSEDKLKAFIRKLKRKGIKIEYLNIGGGWV